MRSALSHVQKVRDWRGDRSVGSNSYLKDQTVRTYLLPNVEPHLVLEGHRAAVNTVALVGDLLASASGDRSIRIWNAENGDLLRVFENHHKRGYVFCEPRSNCELMKAF